MNFEGIDMEKFFQRNSSRHHYMPKFLIEGFKNTKGTLFVYDKKHNKIIDKGKSPKSIFYEWDRNTICIRKYSNAKDRQRNYP
jgi:hypothetical protein